MRKVESLRVNLVPTRAQVEGFVKRRGLGEDVWVQEREDGVQLVQVILHRSPGQ